MEGARSSVIGADGVRIGLLTAGSGPALLLVHGGMGSIESWAGVWDKLTSHRRVTAMDRRGRASSGDDASPYRITAEYADIGAVAELLAAEQGSPVDVFAHSYGATCTLGAAADSAPLCRMVLYEPPGPETVSAQWLQRITAHIAAGQPGPAMASFLTEIIGLSADQVNELRNSPGTGDVLSIVAATMPREAEALAAVNLAELARRTQCPTLLVTGTASPPWAISITALLAAALLDAEKAELPGHGHEAIDTAPDLVVSTIRRFLQPAARAPKDH
jgi:pimeloyl-ACP methyl ester carboxylesterase